MSLRPGPPVRVTAALVATVVLAAAAGSSTAEKAPTALQLRTAEYVGKFVAQLSFLLADEQLQFRDGKKVVSEFMLIRDPGTPRELLAVRDILMVNGTPVQNGRERLIEILQKPGVNAIDRAKQIAAASGNEVPRTFNPLFGIAFLQADYIPRFKVDERDAPVREWPRNTKMLVFVETAKPTLFRGGTFNDEDVPTRGTAWVERDTGRVLQTEIQIRIGSKVTTVTTRFEHNEAQQMFVPTRMTTLKPDAWATYTNYRRFRVNVQETLKIQ
jgi:hypothetical protein